MTVQTIEDIIDKLSEQTPAKEYDFGQDFDIRDQFGEYIVPRHLMTPSKNLRQLLLNIAYHKDEFWNGPLVAKAFGKALQTGSIDEGASIYRKTVPTATNDQIASRMMVFPIVRNLYPLLFANEIGSIQTISAAYSKIYFMDTYKSYLDDALNPVLKIRLANKQIVAEENIHCTAFTEEELGSKLASSFKYGLDDLLECLGFISREIALETNQRMISVLRSAPNKDILMYGAVAPPGYTQAEWNGYFSQYLAKASSDIFNSVFGDATHLIFGTDAWKWFQKANAHETNAFDYLSDRYPGFTEMPTWKAFPICKIYKCPFMVGNHSNKILVVRRGQHWSDTSYIWAPHLLIANESRPWADSKHCDKTYFTLNAKSNIVRPDGYAIIEICPGEIGQPLTQSDYKHGGN